MYLELFPNITVKKSNFFLKKGSSKPPILHILDAFEYKATFCGFFHNAVKVILYFNKQ